MCSAGRDLLGTAVRLWDRVVVAGSRGHSCDVAVVVEVGRIVVVAAVVARWCRKCCMVVASIVAGMEVGLAEVVVDRLEVVGFLATHGLYPYSTLLLPFSAALLFPKSSKIMLQS